MPPRSSDVTFAEARVLLLLLSGLSPHEIATALDVKLSTVRTHIRRLHGKADTHSLVQLVSWGRQRPGVFNPLATQAGWNKKLDDLLTS